MIGFAVVFGLLAVFIAQVWLNNQASMQAKNFEANKKTTAMQTVVVAKQPLRFGTELNASMLREVAWPAEAIPVGAFSKISAIVSGGRRVVLFTTEDISLRDANAILQKEGFRGVMRLDEVKKLDALPVLGTGKTDYKVLRAMIA